MKLVFTYVRHGKTLFNEIRRMQGTCDSPLTEEGIRSAEDTASALCHTHFDRAYVSFTERAKDTAQIILKERNMKAVPLKELKEFSYGSYDGEMIEALQERLDAQKFNDDWTDAGGEDLNMFAERAEKAFRRMISEANDGDHILVVSHGTYFMHLMKTLLKYDREEYIDRMARLGRPLMPNCGIAVFTYEDGVFELVQEPVTADEYRRKYDPKHVNFIYVRHGETMFNVLGRMQGSSGAPLTKKGIEQAEHAAERLKDRKIDKAYVSTAERAIDTAAIILEGRGIEAVEDKRICEVNYGAFEAFIQKDNEEEIMRRHETEDWKDAGGENMQEVWRRFTSFFRYAADHAEDGDTVLLVSHGNLYLNIVEWFGKSRKSLFEEAFKEGRNPMPNCGIFEFSYDSEEGFKVIHYMN